MECLGGYFLLGNGFNKGVVVGMEELAEHQERKYTAVLESLALTLYNSLSNIGQVT